MPLAALAFAQAVPGQSLRIVSPANGTVVHPGQSFRVAVSIARAFQQVLLMGESWIGASQMLASGPYEFTVRVPAKVAEARIYTLFAVGLIGPGQIANSAPLLLDTEPRSKPISLEIQEYPYGLEFQQIGDSSSLLVEGKFSDASTMDMSQSTMTTYVSVTPAIATVDKYGTVTAIANGKTTITVNGVWRIPVTVGAESQQRKEQR